jgi:hypothetical protein
VEDLVLVGMCAGQTHAHTRGNLEEVDTYRGTILGFRIVGGTRRVPAGREVAEDRSTFNRGRDLDTEDRG